MPRWVTDLRHEACKTALAELDVWLHAKLRCVRHKQLKRTKVIADFLIAGGVEVPSAWKVALSGKGWWRLSDTQAFRRAMPLQRFADRGQSASQAITPSCNLLETAVYAEYARW